MTAAPRSSAFAPGARRMRPAPAIGVQGTLRMGETCLMGGLDLCFAPGRCTALLGASGIGKSTLLRLIAGLPVRARLDGRMRAGDGIALAGRVAMMAQDDQLLPWASLLDNVTIGARLRGAVPDPGRARDLLARVGLSGLEGRRPPQLSAGQRQRVALARTLHENRPVVLLDEPFSALDAMTRDRMQNLAVRTLAGCTVLLVTHDPAEAVRMADAAWILSRDGAAPVPLPEPSCPPRAADAPATLRAQADLLRLLRGASAP